MAGDIDFDVDEQLARSRARCQQKLRDLVDAENYQSLLEQQSRELRQQMTRSAKQVACIRHGYNEDLTVIESLSEYRRLQWRCSVQSGTAAAGRDSHGSEPPSRTRSPVRDTDVRGGTETIRGLRTEGKGAASRHALEEETNGRGDPKGDTRRNGWTSGF